MDLLIFPIYLKYKYKFPVKHFVLGKLINRLLNLTFISIGLYVLTSIILPRVDINIAFRLMAFITTISFFYEFSNNIYGKYFENNFKIHIAYEK